MGDTVFNDLGLARGAGVGQAHPLTPLDVLYPEDRNFVDPTHLREREFNLCGIDIDAPGDDEVAASTFQIDISVVVDAAEVPDSEPVVVPRVVRLFGIIPILKTGVVGSPTPESVL
jgi:hypothetical protein